MYILVFVICLYFSANQPVCSTDLYSRVPGQYFSFRTSFCGLPILLRVSLVASSRRVLTPCARAACRVPAGVMVETCRASLLACRDGSVSDNSWMGEGGVVSRTSAPTS